MTAKSLQIAGAGPSGLSAALSARASGLDVTVYEKRPDVGARFHGDFQGLENWTSDTDALTELSQFGIESSFMHTPIYEIVCMCIDGPILTLRATEPVFYLVRRGRDEGTLDQALKAQALKAGVTIRFGERLRHISKVGVVAEGPHRADVIAAGYAFETDMANGCYAAVSDALAPGGYSYLLIDQGRGTVATCLFRDFHNERMYLDATVDFFQREAGLRWHVARRFGGSGNFDRVERTVINDRYYVGETAGFQDALFGFGLRYALTSGFLAGQSAAGGADYAHSWRKRLGESNRASLFNRRLFEFLGDRGRRWTLKYAVAGRNPRQILHRIYAPARWKMMLAARYPQKGLHNHEHVRDDCNCTWCRCQHDIGTANEDIE